MTISKKKARNITIDSKKYNYVVTGNDNSIDLAIERKDIKGSKFLTSFEYFPNELTLNLIENNEFKIGEDLIITPKIISKVIEFAIKNGWKPEKQKENIIKRFR